VILDVILPGVLLLGILVFLHELGHFLVAKFLHVPVYKFSLGFGPALAKVQRGETVYQLSALPLGGYVSMAEERVDADGQPELVDRFTEQPWWKRTVIALAGPGANFVTGYIALIVMAVVGVSLPDYDAVLGPVAAKSPAAAYGLTEGARIQSVGGQTTTSYQDFLAQVQRAGGKAPLVLVIAHADAPPTTVTIPPGELGAVLDALVPPEPLGVVGSVVIGTPAYLAGLQAGDQITQIDGHPITRWRDLTEIVSKSPGKPLVFAVTRDARTFDVTITPQGPPTPGAWEGGRIGVEAPRARNYILRAPLKDAVFAAWPLTKAIVAQTFEGLGAVAMRPFQSASSLGGPQMIMQLAGANAKRGAGDFIYILAVISFAIMAFNLLPLPVLDGGHVFLALVEAVRRRPPAAWFTLAYQRVGLVLIGSFIVFVLYNDLSRSLKHRAAVQRNDRAPQGELQPSR
jgi:regulator of sigma E protease